MCPLAPRAPAEHKFQNIFGAGYAAHSYYGNLDGVINIPNHFKRYGLDSRARPPIVLAKIGCLVYISTAIPLIVFINDMASAP